MQLTNILFCNIKELIALTPPDDHINRKPSDRQLRSIEMQKSFIKKTKDRADSIDD